MEQRDVRRIGRPVSVIGLGTWQLGADWGSVEQETALGILSAAVENGTTFFDTADVYGDGRSEKIIGEFLRSLPAAQAESITVATKMGRRAPQDPAEFKIDNFRAWTDRSRENLGVDTLDLVQLHCPPTVVLSTESVYDALDLLVSERRITGYGVSVETCDEALAAIQHPGVVSVQIILNALRRKPLDQVLPAAQEAGIAVIARVPLASGLLSGKFTRDTVFAADDHRNYNRHGEAFDVGETFSGIDYEVGLDAADRFGRITPMGATPAQFALRWIIEQPGVTTVIPGASSVNQVVANTRAALLAPPTASESAAIKAIYDELLFDQVHDRW